MLSERSLHVKVAAAQSAVISSGPMPSSRSRSGASKVEGSASGSAVLTGRLEPEYPGVALNMVSESSVERKSKT